MANRKQAPIVTRESLRAMIANADAQQVQHIIGRALVALFDRQTQDEKAASTTNRTNARGFSSSDARSGSLTAKTYLRSKALLTWQVQAWTRPVGKEGFPRICKYANQLNEIALERQMRKHHNELDALRFEYNSALESDDPAIIRAAGLRLQALEQQLGLPPTVKIQGSLL